MSKSATTIIPMLARESLYVGIDIGKFHHVAGFVSTTLLARHGRFEGCPVLLFDQSREGFRQLVERITAYVPLEQCYVLLEQTGHYHHTMVQYLQDLDITVYLVHVQTRPKGMLKSDKRDALSLANHLYNQLDKGIQMASSLDLVRRAIPPTEVAATLRGFMRHRYEIVRETTRRKNKLTAICDELFPELTQIFKDPNSPTALAVRNQFPTPQILAVTTVSQLANLRLGTKPSNQKLAELQTLAAHSIGITDLGRQRGLVLEQSQLIAELTLLTDHVKTLEDEITAMIDQSREGRILHSIPGIGKIQAATIIAAIGHIDNFPSAAALRSYFGWSPEVRQTGVTLDHAQLTHKGTRTVKQMMFLIVANAIQREGEWKQIYTQLVQRKCLFDERKQVYVGKKKVMGRIAGQMIGVMYALLKHDADLLHETASASLPDPMLYDPMVHHQHRNGAYKPLKPKKQPIHVTQLPSFYFRREQ